MTDPVLSAPFHWCLITAVSLAHSQGQLEEGRYVQRLAYELYEIGAFCNRFASLPSASSPSPLVRPTGLSGSGS